MEWEKQFDKQFPCESEMCKTGCVCGNEEIKQFISDLLIDEYRKGYNQAIKDFKIENKFGRNSL